MAIAFKFSASATALIVGAGLAAGPINLGSGGSGGGFVEPATPSGTNQGSATITKTEGDLNVAPAGVLFAVSNFSGLATLDPAESTDYDYYEGDFSQYKAVWWVTGGPLPTWSAPVNKYIPHQDPNIQIGQYVWFLSLIHI